MLAALVGIYLLFTVLIGFWASRRVKTSEDFMVAGRNLPMMMAASAMFATWFGSETVLGASSEFVEKGLIGVIEDPFGASLCLLLSGLLVARPLYKLNIITFCDYFKIRFGRRAEIVSAFLMIPSYFGWIAAQLVAMGVVMHTITLDSSSIPDISVLAGIVISAFLVGAYTYVGGMWAVSITDTIQTVVIIVGLLFMAIVVVGKAGGLPTVLANTPEGFFNPLPEAKPLSILQYIAAWITIGLGSIPQQDVFQRVMSAKSEKVAARASYLSAFMYLTIAFLPLLIALAGKQLFPTESTLSDSQSILPQVALLHFGLPLQVMFFGALLSAIMSTTSGAILAPSTVLGENIIRRFYEDLSDKQLLSVVRWSIVLVTFSSVLMALWRQDIYELVGESSAFSLVSLFAPLIAGLYWKRCTENAALASMLVGLLVWILCHFFLHTQIPSILFGLTFGVGALVLTVIIQSILPLKSTNP